MSITTYLGRSTKSLRMPVTRDGIDRANSQPTGIVWQGAVVQGQLSTTEAFLQNDHAARNNPKSVMYGRGEIHSTSNSLKPHA